MSKSKKLLTWYDTTHSDTNGSSSATMITDLSQEFKTSLNEEFLKQATNILDPILGEVWIDPIKSPDDVLGENEDYIYRM